MYLIYIYKVNIFNLTLKYKGGFLTEAPRLSIKCDVHFFSSRDPHTHFENYYATL